MKYRCEWMHEDKYGFQEFETPEEAQRLAVELQTRPGYTHVGCFTPVPLRPHSSGPVVCGAREPHCVQEWAECRSGDYNPACCRFPKSCSVEACGKPLGHDGDHVSEFYLAADTPSEWVAAHSWPQ